MGFIHNWGGMPNFISRTFSGIHIPSLIMDFQPTLLIKLTPNINGLCLDIIRANIGVYRGTFCYTEENIEANKARELFHLRY